MKDLVTQAISILPQDIPTAHFDHKDKWFLVLYKREHYEELAGMTE